jgi:hypothetical protein
MKNIIVGIFVCFVFQQIVFGSDSSDAIQKGNLQSNVSKNKLTLEGAKVYDNNMLLHYEELKSKLKVYPIALDLYQSGQNMRFGGLVMLTAGVIIIPFGFRELMYGLLKSAFSGKNEPEFFIGACLFHGGIGMVAGGVTCRIKGKKRLQRAINEYNSLSSQSYINNVPSYQLGLLDNGRVGFKLNF